MKMNKFWRSLIIALFLGFMIIPVIATLAFSISTRWDRSILPEGVTIQWWQTVVARGAFKLTLKNSILISVITALCLGILVTPSVYWAYVRFPRSKPVFEIITAFSFGIPGVVLALSLLRFYSKVPIPLVNTPAILIAACMVLCFPFMYRPVANSLDSIDVKVLTEAAQSLGCGWWATLFRVIIPNIIPGVISGCLLVFSTVFSEFTLTNLLVGSRFKTFPIYLVEFTRFDGRQASALAVISFIVAWIVCLLVIWITGRSGSPSGGAVGGH